MRLLDSKSSDRQDGICVIDPALALSQYGITLIKRLGKEMELWIGRELWHILENSTLYMQQPELIAPRVSNATMSLQQERKALEETRWALREWEKFRLETDLAGLNIFWIGDSRKESFLPRNQSLEILDRSELIANLLDPQLSRSNIKDYILPLAFRDSIALVLSLESAFILTCQPTTKSDTNTPPEICRILEDWGTTCQLLTSHDPIVEIESDNLRRSLLRASTAKVIWSGVHLAILHLLVPNGLDFQKTPGQPEATSFLRFNQLADASQPHTSLLSGAKVFWYLL